VTEKIKCTACDNIILLSTAEEYRGLCAVCAKRIGKVRKYRKPVERFSTADGYSSYIDFRNSIVIPESSGGQNYIHMLSDMDGFRTLAAYEIRLFGDAKFFSERIERAVMMGLSILNDYDAGKGVDPSFVTMTSFHWGLDALAAGNIELSKEYLSKIGIRPKEEKRNDSKFISAIGHAVKEIVTSGSLTMKTRAELSVRLSGKSVVGYRTIIDGIDTRNPDKIERGVTEVLIGHKFLVRPNGTFFGTPDEIVCFWAIGLINFAKNLGMVFSVPDSEILPSSLIIGRKNRP